MFCRGETPISTSGLPWISFLHRYTPLRQLGAASAAAVLRERALTLEREEEEARKNMREVTIETWQKM